MICLAQPLEDGDNSELIIKVASKDDPKGILAEGVEGEEAEGKSKEKEHKEVGHVIEREDVSDEKDKGGKESPKNQPIVIHDMSNTADDVIQNVSTLQILFLLAFVTAITFM